ncbi:MAG: VOC family protein [Bacteroidota bacterium]
MSFSHLIPMLEVSDLKESIAFYEEKLGFSCTNKMGDNWAMLSSGKVDLMLSARFSVEKYPQTVLTGSIYLYTNEVDQLWERLKDKVEVSYPIDSFDYGMREFGILDCNGYLITIGQVSEDSEV